MQPAVDMALEGLGRSAHPWARRIARVLRTRLILAVWLPPRPAGLTIPFLPVILLNRAYVAKLWERDPWDIVQLLLHEAAHQCWAIWPEWKNWFWLKNVYGPEYNAADAISESIMREAFGRSRYWRRTISYKSPLDTLRSWLGFRQPR